MYNLSLRRYRFPNGGFVMGIKEDVLRVLEFNQSYQDDQEGYHEQILSIAPSKIYVDWKQEFAGNFATGPAILFKAKGDNLFFSESHYWEWKDDGVYNKLTQGRPFIMHFPGKNWKYYNIVAKTLKLCPDFEYVDGSRLNTIREYLQDTQIRKSCQKVVLVISLVLISLTLGGNIQHVEDD